MRYLLIFIISCVVGLIGLRLRLPTYAPVLMIATVWLIAFVWRIAS